MAHDDAEDASLTQNNALANQMLAYQAAEQKDRQMQNNKLGKGNIKRIYLGSKDDLII